MNLDRDAMLGGLKQPKVLVLGLGESGLAIARWCAQHGCALILADSREVPPNLDAARALSGGPHPFVSQPGAPFPLSTLDEGIELIAISPGLSPLDAHVAPLLAAAKEKGIPVWGELSFFTHALRALAAQGYPAQVIAITGTNGKTTTTALTGQLCARAGKRVAVAGNISPAMLDRLAEVIAADALPEVWVLELSSFQLETAQDFAPDAAALLNITQDHLDWHGGFEAYARAKFRILGTAGVTRAVVNRNDPLCAAWLETQLAAADKPADKHADKHADKSASIDLPPVTFGVDLPTRPGDLGIEDSGGLAWLAQAINAEGDDGAGAPPPPAPTALPDMPALAADVEGEDGAATSAPAPATSAPTPRRRARRAAPVEIIVKPLMPVDALRIRGRHNAANALAAVALCRAIGLTLAPLLHGLREYRGEPHRVELLANVNGVDYVDDSKATNVGATVAALDGLASPIVLIAGGDGKGQDFSPLTPAVSRWCKAVMLIGRDAPRLRETFADTGVPLEDHASLEAATEAAAKLAQTGDTVLLSPACASLDMFRNYVHRADVFRGCVEEIAAAQGVTI